ncbi:hypothetical protein P153DRAFT_370621 [Dothidotthia symphoricarpi CBS 119687]|uniref:MARVEL domain-containing protein n=1 Tax=Dothidotthia symphoricarpi CBS 119687 TaxID=1392245 RepID=A0A6A6A0C6_9PLEO|nr:uncharacterized protein P153DRAFT_370621 [Dothidotthia symphoricarpi CBS 119687]KAF2124705.1 hypothetical protein P153DRAFT_370621 [Dothidotthia symphoricarpi CBS 119687]
MKINPAPFHLAQAVFTGLVVVLSIAILGTSAHTLDVFKKQQTSNPWWLPMWPQHFDTQGTKGLVASSVVTLVFSGAFLVMSLVPKFALRQKYTLRALLSLATTLPSMILALITVIWAHILNNNAPEFETIQTWTCKYKNGKPLKQDIAVSSNVGNSNFGSLCNESKFALYGTLIVFLLLGLSMVITMVTWLADKWVSRQARKEEVASVEGGEKTEMSL